jgi:hypothetical protein
MIWRFLLVAFLLGMSLMGIVRAEPALYVHAEDRAAGNRHEAAVRLARALLTLEWPATVEQVRVDGVNGHQVAGLVLSAVKFHRALDAEGFLDEAASLITKSFENSDVEEVDVWALMPIPVPKGAIVSGDLAVPTTRTVFACTVPRDRLAHLADLLHGVDNVYWAPDFAALLHKATPHPAASR